MGLIAIKLFGPQCIKVCTFTGDSAVRGGVFQKVLDHLVGRMGVKGFDKLAGIEGPQVVDSLADADVAYRDL